MWNNRYSALMAILMVSLSGAAADTIVTEPSSAGEMMQRLARDTNGAVVGAVNPATGIPRLLRIPEGKLHLTGMSQIEKAKDFFQRYGSDLGIDNPARQLELVGNRADSLGMTHLSYRQIYEGIPVHAAILRLHFRPDQSLAVFNGTVVPGIDVDPVPTVDDLSARAIASLFVGKRYGLESADLVVSQPKLLVYRAGLARGVPGSTHLVWEVEAEHSLPLREIVYVDAHADRVIDHVEGIEPLTRIVHHYERPNAIWEEGDRTPFSGLETDRRDVEVNNLIDVSAATHNLFTNLSGGSYLSYDGNDAAMNSIYERKDHFCPSPNAAWDGESTNFCYGMVVDDVIAHEWLHAYTQSTHDLVYAWQPGALNESYSDIFGELVDLLHDDPYDDPDHPREDGECSTAGNTEVVAKFEVHSPPSVAGSYLANRSYGNPDPAWSVRAFIEMVDDGVDDSMDACEPLVGFTPGNIAITAEGDCAQWIMWANIADAGAAGVILVNPAYDSPPWIHSSDQTVPTIAIGRTDGLDLIEALPQGVEATISEAEATDGSVRWLMGEGTVPRGVIRDMWNPQCRNSPAAVAQYYCLRTQDSGGVHSNSGIPNHAFALLVDGGTFNRRTIPAIGLTKSAHIYWRAMTVYQVPTTSLADHADALEMSCADLRGSVLTDLVTGDVSPEVIGAPDCESVAQAMAAVQMRSPLAQCEFQPVLEPDPRTIWMDEIVFSEAFDSDPGQTWRRSNQGVNDGYQRRDWKWRSEVPADGPGGALYAPNESDLGDCSSQGDDQSGVMHLESPEIDLPEDGRNIVLAFDHYVATEDEVDGGNLKLSINNGPYQLVEASAFAFNPYNQTIRDWTTSNPLAGEPGFSGRDEAVVYGTWGQSQIDISSITEPGDLIRLRFDFGTDRCRGVDGWYVDNVKVIATKSPIRTSTRRVQP